MKKILLFLFVLFASIAANAQASYNAKIVDSTFTNANAGSFVLSVAGPKTAVTFQYVITKTSGTVAGTIVLAGSIDGGLHYFTLNTYTLTDASASPAVSFTNNAYTKYKVTVTTTGTQVSNYKIWALYR